MPAPRLTTDEYLRTPQTRLPQELVYGVVRDAAAPAPGHQWAVGDVYRCLWAHLERTHAGRVWMSPIDVILDRDRALVVQPDVIVILNARLYLVTDRVWGAPDLVVEVLSPQPRIGRLDERLAWFAQYGVRECWLVHQVVRQIVRGRDPHRSQNGPIAGTSELRRAAGSGCHPRRDVDRLMSAPCSTHP